MIGSLVNRLSILPRWVIIFIDLFIISISISLGYLLRFNFELSEVFSFNPGRGLLIAVGASLVATLITRSYAGIVRYTGVEDGIRIMYATLLATGLCIVINLFYYYNLNKNLIPYSVLGIHFFISFLFLFYYRLLVKTLFSYYKGEIRRKTNVAIFGAGSLGIVTRSILESDKKSSFKVAAFIEDDINKAGKVINGVRIFSTGDMDQVFKRLGIRELIIAVKDLPLGKKNELVEVCINHHVKARIIPNADRWVKSGFRLGQIKDINIEDLLGRETIQLSDDQLFRELGGKVVMITGGAGSIGSELARQVMSYHPRLLVLVDQAESPLYEVESELRSIAEDVGLRVYVADIINRIRIRRIIEESKPEVIFHAAAYKHVPMMELNPSEAVVTNVLGTRNVADLARECKVQKFVMVSTDKAVNPTSIMGCTKRIAEMYVQALDGQALSDQYRTQFVTTRFGNVLGSNGSVIPRFKQQIQNGGPITVTHPDITRYFMTIPEACRLVLEAGVMGNGGEIFIFDMGRPIRIVELAERMIKLSGLEPGKDIDIVFTGLRSGEKLHEELLNFRENTIATHHEKILKAMVGEQDFAQVSSFVDLIEELLADKNEIKLVALLKEIVPEFTPSYFRVETN
ncbi:MAG: polysaccharide biosynthesis protein [Cyclobacteriaceae bacterium]